MKKLINFLLEATIIAGIMFTTVFFVWGVRTSNKELAIIAIVIGTITVFINLFYNKLGLRHKIKRSQMHIHGKLR